MGEKESSTVKSYIRRILLVSPVVVQTSDKLVESISSETPT